MSTFAGKVALVTGGTCGLGLAAAYAFIRRGARVVITARSYDQGQQAAEELRRSMLGAANPAGRQYYLKAHFLREISDDAIDILIDHFVSVPSPLSMLFFQQTGGAMQRGNTAYAHRDALYNLLLIAQWLDPGESERHVRWTRELWQALRPYATGGGYVNDIGQEADEGADQVRAAYGANYQRLVELKQKYDPTNLFRHNQNIKAAV